ncbi:MAG TPA: class I SAM-dependent methyltransferase [Bacteroidia bacterium]|nr:class I SAM-dependent methyltransferase [Bacteroidia bacterium]HNT79711.1 class I SAM-dependent methyltransferase [Bacteroidia bacterium]
MNWHKATHFVSYLRNRKTRYDLHSPLVYNFVDQVIPNSSLDHPYKSIEKLRKQLLTNRTLIMVNDFGTGIKGQKKYQRSISAIAKNSLKASKYYRLLSESIKYFGTTSILELGTSLGISTLYMAQSGKQIHSIEGCENTAAIARENFKNFNANNVQSHIAPFDALLPGLLKQHQFNFIYIDGNHQYGATINYTKEILKQIKQNCIIVYDDIYWSKGMTKAWEEIKGMNEITVSIDFFEFGFAFINCDLSKENFIIKY